VSALLPVYERDLTVVSGRGARVTDDSGRTYLDFAAGVGVNGLGYGDRKVVSAIRKQAGRIVHVSNLYHSEVVSTLAERLVSLAFPSKVFFCNSGTEAVEAAIKFARRVGRPGGRTDLVAFERSFHGRTMGALSLTWTEKYRAPFEPLLPGVRFLPWDDLSAAASAIDGKTAAVFVEPVQGEGGVRPAPPAFLQGLRDICRDTGALLVSEEVQCGLGRTGKLFAYEHAGIRPDILTLAKPLGGGLPLGAVLLREDLAASLAMGDHGSTFGGNPVAAAAAHAVLDRITAPGFLDKVQKKASRLRRGINILARTYRSVVQVRSLGLIIGVEFAGAAADVVQGLRARGVLATRAGEHVLRLLPPLVVKQKDIREFLAILDAVLATGAGAHRRDTLTTGAGGAVA
jgi:predicted acetylornithine/succinylornithine family transaminase